MSEHAAMSVLMVPFNQIEFPEDENARGKLKNISELAESIKLAGGLLEPIGVTNGGTGDKPYRASYGYRRGAALKLLHWGSKEIPVVIVPDEKKTEFNLVENIHREGLSSYDLAQRLRDMEAGEAPGAVDRKYTKAELAKILGKSTTHVGNLIRAINNCGKDAKAAWKKYDAPTTVVFHWAGMKDEKEQEAAVAAFVAEQDRIAAREKALAGGETPKEPKKRSKADEDVVDGPEPLVKGKKATELETAQAILQWKLDTGVIKSKEEVAEAQGQILLIRYMLGDLARFPSINNADKKDYGKWLKAQEEASKPKGEDEEEEEGE
jgi:ParB/RepB/Spo0J family partition protein